MNLPRLINQSNLSALPPTVVRKKRDLTINLRKSTRILKCVAEGTHFWYRKWFIIDLNFLAWLIIATQKN